MMQIPDSIYSYLPGFTVPNGFFENHTGETHCMYLASCTRNEFLFVDKSFSKISGHQPELLIKGGLDWWFSLIHVDDIDQMLSTIFQSCFLRSIKGRLNKPFLLEYRLKDVHGDWIWIRETKCIVSLTEEDKNEFILGIIEGISDAKRDEEIHRKQILKEEGNNPFLKAAAPFLYPMINEKIQKQNNEQSSISKPTKRELEILKLIGEGYSTKQIAGKLFISINTVETHRRHLLEKMQAKNSMQLIKMTTDKFWLKAM